MQSYRLQYKTPCMQSYVNYVTKTMPRTTRTVGCTHKLLALVFLFVVRAQGAKDGIEIAMFACAPCMMTARHGRELSRRLAARRDGGLEHATRRSAPHGRLKRRGRPGVR